MPKAYVFTAFGGPETESFQDVPAPSPGPGELLIRVRAAGVNPVDWKRRTGYRPAGAPAPVVPAVFGGEAAGTVEQVGPGVTGFAPGDEVFGGAAGGYAEYALLAADFATHRPPGVSPGDAATLPVAAATAHDALVQLALPAGSTLLITGAGGGVGVAAAQIARHLGLTVIGTAGAGKKAFVEGFGVTHVEYGGDVAGAVRGAAPDGVDGVLDLIGGDELEAVAGLLTDPAGRLVSAADRERVARLGGAPVQRVRTGAVLDVVAGWVAAGILRPTVTEVFALDDAPAALRLVEGGHARGKVVIAVRGRPDELPLLEALHSTPSRRYLSDAPIPDGILRAILDAAIRGPNGGNRQGWAWIVVRDPGIKRTIAGWYREGWENAYGHRRAEYLDGDAVEGSLSRRSFLAAAHLAAHLEDAPVWVVPVMLGAAGSTNPRLGSSIYGAVQQLLLAARAYGIGSTLTTLHSPHEDDVRRLLGLPDDALTMALIPLGYPARGRWAQPRRRPLEEVVHVDRWGNTGAGFEAASI